jgi:uncharacterized protein (TIGR02246 family)
MVAALKIYMDITPVFQTPEATTKPAVTSSQGQTLAKMYEALHAENWEKFVTYFTPDLLYKVGVNEPVIGPEACRDLLKHIYQTLKFLTHNLRGQWEVGNTIILEMDANYVHKADRRAVQVPCVDVYRFEGDKICEWRVYPDASQTGVRISGANGFDFKDAVHKQTAAFEKASNASDAAAIAEFYTDDAILLPPFAPLVRGKKAIEKYMEGFFARGAANAKIQVVEVRSFGDVAYEIGAWDAEIPLPEGGTTRRPGKYVVIWKRQPDNTLKVLVDIFNTSA